MCFSPIMVLAIVKDFHADRPYPQRKAATLMSILDDIHKKNEHLEQLLKHAAENDRATKVDINHARATNEAMWDNGEFSEFPIVDPQKSLLFGARRDALEAKLNTIDILEAVSKPAENYNSQLSSISSHLRELRYLTYVIIALLIYICWKLS